MSTHPRLQPHRLHWPRRRVLLLLAGLLVAVGIAVAFDRLVLSGDEQVSRPDLQRIVDDLVAGPSKIAPGAVAYVSGPHGSWLGAAGVADTSAGAQIPVDARMRLESVSKIYTATLILQLAQEGKLRVGDTVAAWLPGLLPYGNRITIRELLTMRSGLIDNNDLRNASASEQRANLARVKDARLRAQLLAIAARIRQGPGHGVLADLVDQVRRLAAAAVHAGRRVPLLEHRLRRPRADRRPRRRQAPPGALPRADLPAARPPRDRL